MSLDTIDRKLLIVTALTFIVWTASACSPDNGTATAPADVPERLTAQTDGRLLDFDSLIRQGNRHNQQGDYDKAIKLFNTAIERDSTSLPAYLGRADGYRLRWGNTRSPADYRRSMQDYDEVITKNPISPAAYLGRALMYGEIREMESAFANLHAAIEIEKQNPFLYALRGGAYLEAGEYEQALKDFSSAIELDARNGSYYFGRGLAYQEIGDYRLAENDRVKANKLGFSR